MSGRVSTLVRFVLRGGTALGAILLACGFEAGRIAPARAVPMTFTVNVANDNIDVPGCDAASGPVIDPGDLPGGNGVVSIAEAICAANGNPGPDTIEFSIAGAGPHVITLDELLPPFEDAGTLVDGTSEPSYAGEPVVVLQPTDPALQPWGLWIQGDDITIRGLSIVGFDAPASGLSAGIMIGAGSGGVIEDNFLGEHPNGTINGNNQGVGLLGAATTVRNNFIVGNDTGIYARMNNHSIQGNWIGLDSGGGVPGGLQQGIVISTSAFLPDPGDPEIIMLIGGSGPGEANVISGNGVGISLLDPLPGTVFIRGNLIGTDATGTAAAGNGVGIQVWFDVSGDVVIGGSGPGEGNVIAGNTDTGISLAAGSSGVQVLGNSVGLDANGDALGNTWYGILMRGNDHQIGGVGPGEANLIGGNYWGITLLEGSSNQIVGNQIGLNASGDPRGNGGPGIDVTGSAAPGAIPPSDNLIALNHIAYNWTGVYMGTGGEGNTISLNSIHDNTSLGINLAQWPGDLPSGVTPNDASDADTGPNGLLNMPEIVWASGVVVNGLAGDGCTVELYRSDGDPSGHGEGLEYLAQGTAVGGTFSIPIGEAVCEGITATATDAAGNTSEFSETFVPVGISCLLLNPATFIGIGFVVVPAVAMAFLTYKGLGKQFRLWGSLGAFVVGGALGGALFGLGSIVLRPQAGVDDDVAHPVETPALIAPSSLTPPVEEWVAPGPEWRIMGAEPPGATPTAGSPEPIPSGTPAASAMPTATPSPTPTQTPSPTPSATEPGEPTATPTEPPPTDTEVPPPTDEPTPVPPTPTDTPEPDTEGPRIDSVGHSPEPILAAPCDKSKTTVTARVRDASGVKRVEVRWEQKTSKGTESGTAPMKTGDGENYQVALGPFNLPGIVKYVVYAEDSLGNASQAAGPDLNVLACD